MNRADELLAKAPYTEEQLKKKRIHDLWTIAAALGAPRNELGKYGNKAETISGILEAQNYKEKLLPYCEMCGRFSIIRQKSHIVAEAGNTRTNLLMLCPTCHGQFDSHIKLRLFDALQKAGVKKLPKSWSTPWGRGTIKS